MSKTELKKKNYKQSFQVIGSAKVNDYTFKLDEKGKNNSNYVYNSMLLNVDCGEKYGDIGVELMGGYNSVNPNKLYVHGKNQDGMDDFDNKFTLEWEDRNNESMLKDLGELCFIKVGIEKDEDGKFIEQKFLSEYDAIKYLSKHLKNGMSVNIKGTLKYSIYQDKTQVKKEITSIYLSKLEPENYRATFRQTVLLDKESATAKNIDKEKKVINVNARILEFVSGYKGTDFKGIVPMPLKLEYPVDISKDEFEKTKKQIDLMFKVTKGITEITFEGDLVEGGKVNTVTYEELDKDIKDLVDAGILSLEEALAKYTDGSKEKRMIIRVPSTTKIEVDGLPKVKIDKIENKYTEEDLVIDLSQAAVKAQEAEDSEELIKALEEIENDPTVQESDTEELNLADLFG